MYSKHETSRIKQLFWTSFGQYMKPVPSASGEKVNWPNYKTGIGHIYFRMRAEKGHASIAIELTGSSASQETQFEQFLQLKTLLHGMLGEEWVWESSVADENGHTISRIHTSITGVNVMDQSSWPAIISFLKQRIMVLDEFWVGVREMFE